MERSSPLAAMQPPSFHLGHCGFRSDVPTSHPSLAAVKNLGPNSFNFKDLSMKKSQSGYFSLKPVRGSSPTASLAADLSQNFHIDQRYVQVASPVAINTDLLQSSTSHPSSIVVLDEPFGNGLRSW